MEFYLGVLIFITCMIALALLIYYLQEHRNPKYSFTNNQRDISSIALAIGVPGFHPGEYRPAPHSPGFIPTYMSPPQEPPTVGFVMDATAPPPYPTSDLPPYPTKPPPREYMHELVLPEYMSDDSSTSSEQIYYPPKTAAYSVAKRMSMSANARRMSAAVYNKDTRPTMSADVAAFLIAKRMTKNLLQRREANVNKTEQVEDSQNKSNLGGTQISENIEVLNEPSCKEEKEKIQQKSISKSPLSSETASSTRSSISRIIDSEDSPKRRSGSPYIPSTVAVLHLKSRSGSPYTPLKNDSLKEQNKDVSIKNSSSNPSPPKRCKKPSLKPVENHPLKNNRNSGLKQSEIKASPLQGENNGAVAKRSESLPPKYSKSLPAKRSESLPLKENASERLPLASSDNAYRSHSPTPLHTVEEEED